MRDERDLQVTKDLSRLIDKCPEDRRGIAKRLATEIRWMEKKLVKARKCIEDEEIVIPYNNGGGQTGIRANPAYAEYEKLIKTYDSAVKSFLEITCAEVAKSDDKAGKLGKLGAGTNLKLVAG